MNMYKRPSLRVRKFPQNVHEPVNIEEGTFLHSIVSPEPTVWHTHTKMPIYQKEAYLALLKKNCEEIGIEFKDPNIPDYVPPENPKPLSRPELTYLDHVSLKLRYLKNGTIRVKLETSIASLYEKYYSKNKLPPMKLIIQAYKSVGFDEEFLEKIKKNYEKSVVFAKKVGPAIDAIFNKEPTKKIKKKKKEEVIEDDGVPDDEEEPDDPEDDDPGEDGEMDVEVDEELDEEPQQEEIYISDGDD